MKTPILFLTTCLFFGTTTSLEIFTRTVTPPGWTKSELPASDDSPGHFVIALKQRNLDELESLFWNVSTPGNPKYQEFSSRQEILRLIAPRPQDALVVKNWLLLQKATITKITDHGDAFEIYTTVAHASYLFSTHFYLYSSSFPKYSVILRNWGTYSIPDSVAPFIVLIEGISNFPVAHYSTVKTHSGGGSSSSSVGGETTTEKAALDLMIVPQTVMNLYQLPEQTSRSALNNSQGVIEFEEEYFSPANLAKFGHLTKRPTSAVAKEHVIGDNNPEEPGDEAELDLQMIGSVNIEADNWFWIENSTSWLYTFVTHMFATENLPWVNSISYGWSEMDQCRWEEDICRHLGVDSYQYVARINVEFMKLGLRGISLLVSSGDSGVHGRTDGGCMAPTFRPDFPGSSPFITSVGGTQLMDAQPLTNPPPICTKESTATIKDKKGAAVGRAGGRAGCAANGREVAIDWDITSWATGGGFSNVSLAPDYQRKQVQQYLEDGTVVLPPASMYNSSGRGFPDVAAIGHHCLIYSVNGVEPVDGTSCSAPIFAGVVSLLNQASFKKSGKPLGFLNPLLYAMYEADPNIFHDVTEGNNRCTEMGCSDKCFGFFATAGWDPVSGLGTPNYQLMHKFIVDSLTPTPSTTKSPT